MASKAKVLVVEDNYSVQLLIKKALEKEFHSLILGEGEKVVETARSFRPDIILLDVMLPGMSGYEVCSQIKADESLEKIPVVFLSAKTGNIARTTGYNLGALNYVEKPFDVNELKSIVSSLLSSGRLHSRNTLIEFGDIEIDVLRQELRVQDKLIPLTASEFKLLCFLSQNENMVFSREKLLEIVSPGNLEVTDRTIDNHISSLRKKMKGSSVEFKSIYSEGYKLVLK